MMFEISEDAKKKVYKMFDRTEEMVDEDVEILKKWIKTQPHLPEVMDDVKIKNFLHLNKFSIEKTKPKIDMYYTMRSLMPELYTMSNPKVKRIQQMLDKLHICVFPKALDGIHRVTAMKIKKRDVLSVDELTMLLYAVFEVRLYEDFMFSDIFIFDMENVSLNDIKNITVNMIKSLFTLYQKIYSFRMKNVYFLNMLPFMSSIISILKVILKAKFFERIIVCKDDKILHEIFPKDQIPKDFGGTGPSLQELSNKMRQKFSEYQERFDLLDMLRVDENLRPEKLNNDEVLGFYGNFKKLDVD